MNKWMIVAVVVWTVVNGVLYIKRVTDMFYKDEIMRKVIAKEFGKSEENVTRRDVIKWMAEHGKTGVM